MEPVEVINKRLFDRYGRFEDGRALWRVVWSDDQIEKRYTDFDPSGLFVGRHVAELPKYGYILSRYVLERLLPVYGASDVVESTSYEPIWTFEDAMGNPLPPKWEAIEIIIDTVYKKAAEHTGYAKYKMPESEQNTREALEHKSEVMKEMLFGNETSVGDALSVDSAVGFGVRQRNDSKFVKVH